MLINVVQIIYLKGRLSGLSVPIGLSHNSKPWHKNVFL